MARRTTKLKVDTPERRADLIAEIYRLHEVIKQKDAAIKQLQMDNEDISNQLIKAKNDG